LDNLINQPAGRRKGNEDNVGSVNEVEGEPINSLVGLIDILKLFQGFI